ncbi:DinB family protein [Virgibacillus dakarensis]|uniref:DinB family protein n=1 Tax=Virgibacillus dakarensis TaxID=1917889 RepID=UPI001E4219E1|nr:DinB family protein [Virgibacillus dakarensis]
MNNTKELIDELEQFNTWITSLKNMKEDLFFTPIKEGKWSPAEIISHITFWDRYILDETLPQMKTDADITSIAFEPLNKKAAIYALSGVSMNHLLETQIETRKELVSELRKKAEEEFFATFTLNGETIDEYSGYPHTMYNYFASFAWHDKHHKQQIENFLEVNKVQL